MKRVIVVILSISFVLTFGWVKSDNVQNELGKRINRNNLKQLARAELATNNKYPVSNKDKVINTKNIDNPFFFKKDVSYLSCKMSFIFAGLPVRRKVRLHVIEKADLQYGELYQLKLDSVKGIPANRLSLGYFYIQKDKIYKIELTAENFSKLKTSGKVPNDSVIVCQNTEIKDVLKEAELGWHHYVLVNGDKREYHSYNNQVETGYYETFVWRRNKGLINYRSGYGAERESIELQLSGN